MNYIIIDLEWNNVYSAKKQGFINEIIEIGAVMLDENLEKTDEFSCFVKSQIGKKLRSTVKQLTHITNDDIKNGVVFTKAFSNFKEWIGERECVVLTWGDGDIRVLIENFRFLNGINTVPFLKYYIDIQRYFQIKMKLPLAQQIGLFNAAELSGIDPEIFSHHRALDDSLITAECFRKIFDPNDFFDSVVKCDSEFYGRLSFKPHAISNINNPLVDKKLLDYRCDECGIKGKILKEWRYSNQYFRAVYQCPHCGKKVRVAVRFKKYFDRLDTRKTVTVISECENTKPVKPVKN